ncbi:MAG: hypothetical protein KZQ66_01675 [Candidatus Thiodiazotropha sp. (ex Lucinoma aequizonata)]|nr:hypothetical protein [Candidatus Thiodiazotropha sp. (ex Lucinoma aequizonata)]MCU7889590.1 hypothetical protein [Candidatus Thiodiazotropha sp. (ex Lucinoma aequizonata)]MCU7895894.1 hypothetical protein [Candidatus Thiodiazotropha sp. (ex Lucinoma aequizonata)]MCU7897519.1 hypothetical protein [Candidatus Thiodiazotropha sp. (ex Lucinoma aequizonata)]MCU7900880.1 hypothetical protein [Candidatus Thiodiazotropha sp. (ex Lucinoma aequizonata)]
MDSSTIELPGSDIESVSFENNKLTVSFSRAIIIKTMRGSEEKTRWWQAGALVFDGAEIKFDLPASPSVCDGGDVGENIYTYRDMIPIPLESQGWAHCDLKIKGSEQRLQAWAEGVKLIMDDRPHYIEHLRKSE